MDDERSTRLTRTIGRATGALGSFPAILLSFALVLAWFLGGLFVSGHFGNNTYQLVINTGTTIVTFWMVFIIQNTQNRDGRALQTKLDAQTRVLVALADKLGVDCDLDALESSVAVEDAPEPVIKEEQDRVRDAGSSGTPPP